MREVKDVVKRIKFPRTLYNSTATSDDPAIKWGRWKSGIGGAYHSVLVVNENEHKAAIEMGYLDNLAKANSIGGAYHSVLVENEEKTDANT